MECTLGFVNPLILITMENTISTPVIIGKEEVEKPYFPQDDVLADPAEKMMRKGDIIQALRLGNIERYKVKIIFEDTESIRVVHTTIWAVTEKRIALKRGVVIPVHRIHSIKFF